MTALVQDGSQIGRSGMLILSEDISRGALALIAALCLNSLLLVVTDAASLHAAEAQRAIVHATGAGWAAFLAISLASTITRHARLFLAIAAVLIVGYALWRGHATRIESQWFASGSGALLGAAIAFAAAARRPIRPGGDDT